MGTSGGFRSTEDRRGGTFRKQFRRASAAGREPPSSADTEDPNGSFTPVRRTGEPPTKGRTDLGAAGDRRNSEGPGQLVQGLRRRADVGDTGIEPVTSSV